MIAFALLLLATPDDASALLAKSRALIAGERCTFNANTTDVTVCGRRGADRFRVPFVVHDAGNSRHEPVPVERDRLLNRTNPVKELSPFLVHGGMTGVTVSSKSGLTGATARKLAP